MRRKDFGISISKQEGECTNILIWINTGTAVEKKFYCGEITMGSPATAAIVADDLAGQLEEMMREIRHRNYLAGWNDAKKKKAKRASDCFSGRCRVE